MKIMRTLYALLDPTEDDHRALPPPRADLGYALVLSFTITTALGAIYLLAVQP